jgi:leader peptidase (prepilin peptidase) / N-methyltransferase
MSPVLEAPARLWQSFAVAELVAFLFGLTFGSFFNVCIRRLPRHESVVSPRSHCPACGTPIRARDNIPVLSYLLLRGRCRSCRTRISPEYPLVELLTGALFAACYGRFGATIAGAKWTLFCSILLVLIFTDFHDRILPNRVNYFGLAAGLALSPFVSASDGLARWILNGRFALGVPEPVLRTSDSVLGAVVAGGLLWIFAEGYFRLRGREGMGLGDVKMMAMAGAFLGARNAILMLMLGSLIGSVLGLSIVSTLFLSGWKREVAERAHRMGLGDVGKIRLSLAMRYQLPFGTYLGIAGIFLIFAGGPLLHWYLSASSLAH